VEIFDFIDLDFGAGIKTADSFLGKVIFIDPFGNIVTNISSDNVDLKSGDILEIENIRVPFLNSYGFCNEGEPLALIGSHGYLEIAVNQGNAARFFDKKIGDEIIAGLFLSKYFIPLIHDMRKKGNDIMSIEKGDFIRVSYTGKNR